MIPSATIPFDEKKYRFEDISKLNVGIVFSEMNFEIVDKLKASCILRLKQLGLSEELITEFLVPGSFELPWGAKQFLGKGGFDGIICFGCVIKGETRHDEYINNAVSRAIMGLSLASNIPILFGVLTTNSHEQAIARAGGKKGNKGLECAESLIKMIYSSRELKNKKSLIGFSSK